MLTFINIDANYRIYYTYNKQYFISGHSEAGENPALCLSNRDICEGTCRKS